MFERPIYKHMTWKLLEALRGCAPRSSSVSGLSAQDRGFKAIWDFSKFSMVHQIFTHCVERNSGSFYILSQKKNENRRSEEKH